MSTSQHDAPRTRSLEGLEKELLYLRWQLDLERQFSKSLQEQLREEKEYSKSFEVKFKQAEENHKKDQTYYREKAERLDKKVVQLEEEKTMFAEQLNYLLSRNRDSKVFTNPSESVPNKIYDNANGDYILFQLDIISAPSHDPLIIMEFLGKGSYGQVVKCLNMKTREFVAVKVLKNQKEYYDQGLLEIQYLQKLNKMDDCGSIVALYDSFMFRGHLCLVFELLDDTLLRHQSLRNVELFQPPNLPHIRDFVYQMLLGLRTLHRAGVIHTDMKPDNIMMQGNVLKIIDLGSARDGTTGISPEANQYVTTRPYRAPEVFLGAGYNCAVDMWSLGCISAELFLGRALFPSYSSWEHVRRLIIMFGGIPATLIRKGTLAKNYFDAFGHLRPHNGNSINTTLKPLTWQEFVNTILQAPFPLTSRNKFNEVVMERFQFVEFLGGCLQLDPALRWSPDQALSHPFIAGIKTPVVIPAPIAVAPVHELLPPPYSAPRGGLYVYSALSMNGANYVPPSVPSELFTIPS